MAYTPPLSLTNPTGTGQLGDQVTTAFEQIAYFALRSQPLYEMICDVRSTAQSHNAATVQFTFYPNMDQVTGTLTEATDVTPVALSDSKVDVALNEYGSSVITTALIRGTSFLNVDADAANIIGYNMVDSIDKVVSNILMGGTNVIYAQGSAGSRPTARNGIADACVYGATEGRMAVAQLRGDSAPGWENGNYMAIIHPDVSYDLRGDTAVTDVIQYQLYQDGAPIRAGSIGTFNGINYIENPRAPILADAGASNVDVYQTLICGRQAAAKAFSRAPGFGEQPSIVFGPVTDTLRRFNPVGWYHLAGWNIFRQECMRRVESSSSIGDNT